MDSEPAATPDKDEEQPPTKAADQHEDQSPTQLADPVAAGETQSINAWSLAGDAGTDVMPYHPRSWRVPIIVAATAAVVAIGTVGVYLAWGHQGAPAPKPSAAPGPPPLPPLPSDPDQRFIELLKRRGYVDKDPIQTQQLIGDAHEVFDDITSGKTKDDEIQQFLKEKPDFGIERATERINTMIEAYHPVPGVHYAEIETYPDGKAAKDDWWIAPCGDGCAYIAGLGKAHLVDGKWKLDGSGGVSCEGGGDVHDAIGFHYSWDPHTLLGKVDITNNVAACNNPVGWTTENKLELEPADR